MSGFYFGDGSSSGSDDESTDSLPFPAPLPRSDFLKSDFSAAQYLSNLPNRHQTLEDLRAELRTRSQQLNQQLLDLVNSNYQDFLGLGTSLKGGDEKVEEVRVGLLGFQKDVENVRRKIQEKQDEVEAALAERKEARENIMIASDLMEFLERLEELEAKLTVDSADRRGNDDIDSDSEESSEEEDETPSLVGLSRVRRHVRRYLYIKRIAQKVGAAHPFVQAQDARLIKARNTLLIDLSTALKQAYAVKGHDGRRLLQIIAIYREMDEAQEAIQAFKALRKA